MSWIVLLKLFCIQFESCKCSTSGKLFFSVCWAPCLDLTRPCCCLLWSQRLPSQLRPALWHWGALHLLWGTRRTWGEKEKKINPNLRRSMKERRSSMSWKYHICTIKPITPLSVTLGKAQVDSFFSCYIKKDGSQQPHLFSLSFFHLFIPKRKLMCFLWCAQWHKDYT